MKKTLNALEDKTNKMNNKKLTKSEKSLLGDLEIEMISMKEKIISLENNVEHLNDVKYEDFAKQVKREILDNSETQVVKVTKELKALEERINLQNRANENLQKNLFDLKKKLDTEVLKAQDMKLLQSNETKWKQSEDELLELNNNIDNLWKKMKQHDNDIFALSDNVFYYSYKEMAASFNERVENRLSSIKQQMKDLTQKIQATRTLNHEHENSKLLLEKVKKLVEDKIDANTDTINQKLISLAHSNSNSLVTPKETIEGKKILFKLGESFIDHKDVQASLDGTFHLKKNDEDGIYTKKVNNLTRLTKESLQPTPNQKTSTAKLNMKAKMENCNSALAGQGSIKCKLGLRCISRTCKYDHDTELQSIPANSYDYTNLMKKTPNCRNPNDRLTPYKKGLRDDWIIDELCELKDQCPQSKCPYIHNRESCKRFKACRNTDCGKRHHPCREGLIKNKKTLKSTVEVPKHAQFSYLHPISDLQSDFQPSSYLQNGSLPYTYFPTPNLPSFYHPWQGYGNLYPSFPGSQPYAGEWTRRNL